MYFFSKFRGKICTHTFMKKKKVSTFYFALVLGQIWLDLFIYVITRQLELFLMNINEIG